MTVDSNLLRWIKIVLFIWIFQLRALCTSLKRALGALFGCLGVELILLWVRIIYPNPYIKIFSIARVTESWGCFLVAVRPNINLWVLESCGVRWNVSRAEQDTCSSVRHCACLSVNYAVTAKTGRRFPWNLEWRHLIQTPNYAQVRIFVFHIRFKMADVAVL